MARKASAAVKRSVPDPEVKATINVPTTVRGRWMRTVFLGPSLSTMTPHSREDPLAREEPTVKADWNLLEAASHCEPSRTEEIHPQKDTFTCADSGRIHPSIYSHNAPRY